jgi:hypothetical protein
VEATKQKEEKRIKHKTLSPRNRKACHSNRRAVLVLWHAFLFLGLRLRFI